MCKISRTIKFCTCNNADANMKDNWTYYRLAEGNDVIYIGEIIWSKQLKPEINQNHERTICRMLNKVNCFDFEVTPKEGDLLKIIFNDEEDCMVIHNFLFKKNKWKTDYITSQEVRRERDILISGKIKDGLTSPITMNDFTMGF